MTSRQLRVEYDKMETHYRSTALDIIKEMPSYATLKEKSTFVRDKMLEKFPLIKWSCEAKKVGESSLSFSGDPSQLLTLNIGDDHIRLMVLKSRTDEKEYERALEEVTSLKGEITELKIKGVKDTEAERVIQRQNTDQFYQNLEAERAISKKEAEEAKKEFNDERSLLRQEIAQGYRDLQEEKANTRQDIAALRQQIDE